MFGSKSEEPRKPKYKATVYPAGLDPIVYYLDDYCFYDKRIILYQFEGKTLTWSNATIICMENCNDE